MDLVAFSNAVREELRTTGVTVTVPSPGFMVDEGMYVPYRTAPPWYFGSSQSAVVARKAVEAMPTEAQVTLQPVDGMPRQ